MSLKVFFIPTLFNIDAYLIVAIIIKKILINQSGQPVYWGQSVINLHGI
jgi:hypothetical protein